MARFKYVTLGSMVAKIRRSAFWPALGLLAWGCVAPGTFQLKDRGTAERVKKVAIMPFFDANLLSNFDPLYTGPGASSQPAKMFDDRARKVLGARFEIIGQEAALESLRSIGAVYRHVAGAWAAVKDPEEIRWGITPKQALEAGKALGADAVLLCAQGQYMRQKGVPVQAVSVRLLSVETGKVLWGGFSSGQPGVFSRGMVVDGLLQSIAKEAP
ncbi:MAG: hypothetical protein FD126_197 [Elusimicrobia bacterium]|nr:MAG: hypothetical protein FD126_197 [Elusimicrobiota bacterium]